MSADYKGDTHGKRLARLHFWLTVREYFGAEFPAARVAYLASHEGGDASVLRALGHPAQHQLAVDIDHAALCAFSGKFPDVPVFCGDIARLPAGPQFDVIFLDSCRRVCPRLLLETQACARRVRDQGVLAVACQRGREDEVTLAAIAEQRERYATSPFVRAQESRVGGLGCDERGRPLSEPSVRALKARLGCGRAGLIYEGLFRLGESDRFVPLTVSKVTYQSRTAESPGTPMLISAWWIARAPRVDGKRMSALRFPGWRNSIFETVSKPYAVARERVQLASLDGGLVAYALPENWRRWRIFRLLHSAQSQATDFTPCAKPRDIIETADRLKEHFDESKVPSLLGLSVGRLAALRAHVTRGSYEARRAG